MKRLLLVLTATIFIVFCSLAKGNSTNTATTENYWQLSDPASAPSKLQILHPSHYLVYTLDESGLSFQLNNAGTTAATAALIELPLADGSFRTFKVWNTPMMPDNLVKKYPQIKTFTGVAIGNAGITAKIEMTVYGFSAMIYDGDNTGFVDPFDNIHDGFYLVHYKRDEVKPASEISKCTVKETDGPEVFGTTTNLLPNPRSGPAYDVVNGTSGLLNYRIAISADSFYVNAATGIVDPTIAQALSKITITMDRVNGIYNRELSVQLNLCSLEDTLIWGLAGHQNGNDPFAAINYNELSCMTENQTICNTLLGNPNYDLGVVFTNFGEGVSDMGHVCRPGYKALSSTGCPTPYGDGFDVDFVAHEIGHAFNSGHTFNDNTSSGCSGNAFSSFAYEPGSGATIMDYAGACSPDDLQHSDYGYFSQTSLAQIQLEISAGHASWCPVITPTGNGPVSLAPFAANYTIPYKTPFELQSPTATDSLADSAIVYQWAQWNLGDFGSTFSNTHLYGPIFRSFPPVSSPTRVFPQLNMVLSGVLSNAGTEYNQGEKVPDTARSMTFKLVVRNFRDGYGCFLFPTDSVLINAVANSTYGGFKVTSQDDTTLVYNGNSTQTITWQVAGTDAAPVSATNVAIWMSVDSGVTWTYNMGIYPNTGSASVTVPNPPVSSSKARFKVKGDGNVFFNINNRNFTVLYNDSAAVTTQVAAVNDLDNISIFPVPAGKVLHVIASDSKPIQTVVTDMLGKTMWSGTISGKQDITTALFPPGIYYIRFVDAKNRAEKVKSFAVE